MTYPAPAGFHESFCADSNGPSTPLDPGPKHPGAPGRRHRRSGLLTPSACAGKVALIGQGGSLAKEAIMKYVVAWKPRFGGSAAENEAAVARLHEMFSKWTPASDVTIHQFVARSTGRAASRSRKATTRPAPRGISLVRPILRVHGVPRRRHRRGSGDPGRKHRVAEVHHLVAGGLVLPAWLHRRRRADLPARALNWSFGLARLAGLEPATGCLPGR
jgi:hypothetical protein